MAFKVTQIVDAQTIQVEPGWVWGSFSGNLIRIHGFNYPSLQNSVFIINKLNTLLLNKDVDLKNPVTVVVGNIIEVSVYLNNVDILVYFPELKTPA